MVCAARHWAFFPHQLFKMRLVSAPRISHELQAIFLYVSFTLGIFLLSPIPPELVIVMFLFWIGCLALSERDPASFLGTEPS